jgi:hypothetical protein
MEEVLVVLKIDGYLPDIFFLRKKYIVPPGRRDKKTIKISPPSRRGARRAGWLV